ncbi:ATP synthase F0 sector subunit 4 [Rhodotorula toruloides ATCC 204091]|uniref:ATP synthase subunit 4 n=1 Tax=Rhodotorula toruloides TaxID=5286 RepID=A0A0K3CEX5_RHOTO|nr:ATP synthase F0 sector subunit 4 [Rhodotorula toruloides ATCC 204091]KAK4336256.1 ATP synthase subunit 4, mitochondrial [Rhodotorula toruloides]PRQ74433.1 ATP synthase F0 sector subunit 4 [Rhodotorula toruloides]
MLRSAAARVGRQALQPRVLAPVRFQSTQQPAPAAKASALIDALPGNSLVSKTGIVTLTAATTAAAISNELFVLNEEVVILGSFVVFIGYVSTLVREPYREWADGQIQKVKDLLNTSRAAHTNAVKERIESVGELKDVEGLTKDLFALSKARRGAFCETAELEHETFRLKQQAAVAADIKSVLDSWVRFEAQVREQEQRDLVETVVSNVQKQLTDKKLQKDILVAAVAEVEQLVKSKAI